MRAIKVKKMKRINRLQFTPDGARLLVFGGIEVRGVDDVAYLDPASGEEVNRIETISEGAAVSPDGSRVVSVSPYVRRVDRRGGSLHWREAEDGAAWIPLPAAKGTRSRGLAFDASGRLAVVNAKWVYGLPASGGEPQLVLASESKQMNASVFSPAGRRILTGAHDGSLRVWDAADGKPVRSFDWQIGPVTAVAFAPDGLTCAAAGLNGKVVIWDADG